MNRSVKSKRVMTVSVACEGARILIGIDAPDGLTREGAVRYAYYLMSDFYYQGQKGKIEVPGCYTDEEPRVNGGQVSRWFHEELMDKLFPLTGGDEKERAWDGFCDAYDRKKEKITTWIGVFENTENVVCYPHEILEITIHGQTCRLEGDEILRPVKFSKWYAFRFRSPVIMSKDDWAELLGHWLDDAEEGEFEETVAPGMACVQDILNYMSMQEETITTTREEMEENSKLPYLLDGELLLSSKMISGIVEHDEISMRKLASIMKPYLLGPSVKVRVGSGTQNFWRFDPIKVGIDLPRTLDEFEEASEKEQEASGL